jgi:hypothetical protein
MSSIGKRLQSGLAAGLLLAGAVTVARGQVVDSGASFGSAGRGLVTITGSVVCAKCSLDEARKAQPYDNHLYQLSHRRGQLVLKVTAVDKQAMFESITWPPRLWVRGADSMLDQLGAEENFFKEITVTGMLHTSRTLDVFDISVKG